MRAVTYTKSGTTTSIAMNTTVTVYGTTAPTKVQVCESLAESTAASAQSTTLARPHPCMPLTPRLLTVASAWSSGAPISTVRIYNSKISASASLRNTAPLGGVASTSFTLYRLDITIYAGASPLTPPIAGLLGEGGRGGGGG